MGESARNACNGDTIKFSHPKMRKAGDVPILAQGSGCSHVLSAQKSDKMPEDESVESRHEPRDGFHDALEIQTNGDNGGHKREGQSKIEKVKEKKHPTKVEDVIERRGAEPRKTVGSHLKETVSPEIVNVMSMFVFIVFDNER